MKKYAIVLASGIGARSGLSQPKQFFKIAGKTILEHSLESFEKHEEIDGIIVVCHPEYINKVESLVKKGNFSKIRSIIAGGETRQESSLLGISSILEEEALVLIHDSVRPFLQREVISRCFESLKTFSAVDVAIPTADTLIQINPQNHTIEHIPDRNLFMRGQTPQAFRLSLLKKAHQQAIIMKDTQNTDDCSLVLKYSNVPVKVVLGDEFNQKITTPVDVALADKLFQLKALQNLPFHPVFLKGKVIIVFGASKGIGASIVELAKKSGAIVYEASRSSGIDIINYGKVNTFLEATFKREQRIDAIILTAGVLHIGDIISRSMKEVEEEVNINYLACVHIAKIAHPFLKKTKGALVFFTSSSYTKGRAHYSIYSSIKAALVNFTQALAEEWWEDQIRVNIMNPERTATPMRFNSFGEEPKDTLLNPQVVATQTLAIITSPMSGQVVDIKREY